MSNLQKTNLATTVSITSTYSGEFSSKYISASLLSGNTLSSGVVEIMPNVKYKSVIQRVETGDLVANAGCEFDPTSSVTLTEIVCEPEPFQVNLQLCKQNFIETWDAVQMGMSAFNPNGLPTSFSDYLIAHVSGKVAEHIEETLWEGVNANPGEFDGFHTLGLASASTIKLTGTTVNAGNVIAELGSIIDAIPSKVYGKENLYLYVSQNIARAYVRALGGFVATIGGAGTDNKGTQWYNGQAGLSFDGVQIFVANGLDDDHAMAGLKEDFIFSTGLLNDTNEVKLLDMADLDGSQNVRIIMRMTAVANLGIESDIVVYGT
jgi:hypothetical protein